jgi:hypothetical protein
MHTSWAGHHAHSQVTFTSASVGLFPTALRTVPSSLVVMQPGRDHGLRISNGNEKEKNGEFWNISSPSPSRSKRLKASFNSAVLSEEKEGAIHNKDKQVNMRVRLQVPRCFSRICVMHGECTEHMPHFVWASPFSARTRTHEVSSPHRWMLCN